MVIVSKQLTIPSMRKKLSDYAEGDIIKIPENGTPVEFYVAKHDYESGLNGPGRTLVVRKDMYDQRQWHKSNVNAYASCALDSWFNNTYYNLLDADIKAQIAAVAIPYTPGDGNNTVSTLERAVFALSVTELGWTVSLANTEGSALPIANILQIAHSSSGGVVTQWTRSPNTNSTNIAFYLSTNASVYSSSCTYYRAARPAFTLPSTTKFDPDTNVIIG